MGEPGRKFIAGVENASLPLTNAPTVKGWRIPILSDNEYSLLLGQANMADNIFVGSNLARESYDTFPFDNADAESLRLKLMLAIEVLSESCCIEPPPGDPAPSGPVPGGIGDPPILPLPPIGERDPGLPPDDNYTNDPIYGWPGGSHANGGGHVDLNCAENIILDYVGTNHVGNLRDYGMPDFPSFGVNLLPVNDLLVDHIPIKAAIDDKITASGTLPATGKVTEVQLGYTGAWADKGQMGFHIDGGPISLDYFNFRATRPHLEPVNSGHLSEIELRPDKLFELAKAEIGGAWSGGIKLGVDIVGAEATAEQHTSLSHYDHVTEVFFFCRMPGMTPIVFVENTQTPRFELCITGYDYSIIVSKFSGHFDLDNLTTRENPYVSGQMVWYSDEPDGYVSGMSAAIPALWTGSESTGHGNVVLANNTSNPLQLIRITDGYSPVVDMAYTTATVTLQAASSAQTVYLNINTTNSGPGTNFATTAPDGGYTGPPYVYFPVQKVLTFDISSLGLTSSSTIFRVGLGPEGMYIWDWTIVFS